MVYVTGDLHGDISRLKTPAVRRLGRKDTLIVLGDFGFLWTGDEGEAKTLRWLGRRRYTLLFIEGTHDNYDLLRDCPAEEYAGGRARTVSGKLRQLMRGQVYEIDGLRLFSFGGGESLDKADREEGVNWWRSELPTEDEMDDALENLAANGFRVDYMLTHEGPARLVRFIEQQKTETSRLAGFFDSLAEKTAYRQWLFAQYHKDLHIGPRAAVVYRKVLPLAPPETGE